MNKPIYKRPGTTFLDGGSDLSDEERLSLYRQALGQDADPNSSLEVAGLKTAAGFAQGLFGDPTQQARDNEHNSAAALLNARTAELRQHAKWLTGQ